MDFRYPLSQSQQRSFLVRERGGQLKEAGADAVLAQPLNDHSFAAEIRDPAEKTTLINAVMR